MAKKRYNVNLTEETTKRVQAALKRLPGLSLSAFVDDYLAQMAPLLEAVAEGVEAGDPKALQEAFALAVGSAMLHNFGEGDDLSE